MDNLIQLVKLYIEEVSRQNLFINHIIANLRAECKDIENIDKVFEAMQEINNGQGQRIKRTLDPTKPVEVEDLSLEIIETSAYLSNSSQIIISMFPDKNSFVKIVEKIKTHSDYNKNLMDDLLRTYLVNIPDELLKGYIDNIKEGQIDKVVASLNRMISLKQDDNYARELVDKLLERKIELMTISTDENSNDIEKGPIYI